MLYTGLSQALSASKCTIIELLVKTDPCTPKHVIFTLIEFEVNLESWHS